MSRETRVPAIPEIRDDNIKEVLSAIKATLQVREGSIGNPLDQVATFRDLVNLNLATEDQSSAAQLGGSVGPINPVIPPPTDGYNPEIDYTTPPAPTGLRASGGFSNVFLSWDGAPYRNHSYTEIWRGTLDNLGDAVLIGTTAANVYADPAQPNTTYYYWIRFVSRANVTGPYNQTSGTPATTAIDVAAVLPALEDEIRNSQLFVDLGTRISRIDEGSVLSVAQIATLNEARAIFDAQLSQNTSASLALSRITDEQATRISLLGTRVGDAESSITTLQSTTATQATSLTNLTTRVGTAESSITDLQTTTATQATSLSQLTSTVSGNTTSIQTLTSVTNGLSGQYTVKIDNNGHVSGFGLASTTVNGTPTSAFIVRADRFAITGANDTTDPLGTLNPTNVPFVVLTTPTVIGGVTYPAGVWIKTAFIADATISSAKIQDLVADKITTGNLTAAIGITTGRISGGVNPAFTFGSANFGTGFYLGNDGGVYKLYVGSPDQNMNWNGSALTVTGNINAVSGSFRNITVFDNQNRVILSSGGINTSILSLPAGQVTGLGTLATQNSVTTGQVTGLGALATQNNVFVGSTVRFADGSVMNTGDFVNRLSQINSTNISTFIASAAIGDAYIGNLSAAKITSGFIAADRLDSTVINAKVTNIDAAVIQSGTIADARIGQASIDTLNIRGAAVTTNAFGEGGTITVNGVASGIVNGASATINMPSGSSGVVINIFALLNGVDQFGNATSAGTAEILIFRNGTFITSLGVTFSGGNTFSYSAAAFDAFPANGNNTYTLAFRSPSSGPGANTTFSAFLPRIVVSGGKR